MNSSSNSKDKLIECQTCFRTFYTQAQFGQHSRICRDRDDSTSTRKFITIGIQHNKYKYSYLERQTKNELEIKSRFRVTVRAPHDHTQWKEVAKQCSLHDNGVKALLKLYNLSTVHFTTRYRKKSGLIVANFIMRSVPQTSANIHSAKKSLEEAIDLVISKLPPYIAMEMHLCKIEGCRELVIRDTEGFCSRHRAQKYHTKVVKTEGTRNGRGIPNTANTNRRQSAGNVNDIKSNDSSCNQSTVTTCSIIKKEFNQHTTSTPSSTHSHPAISHPQIIQSHDLDNFCTKSSKRSVHDLIDVDATSTISLISTQIKLESLPPMDVFNDSTPMTMSIAPDLTMEDNDMNIFEPQSKRLKLEHHSISPRAHSNANSGGPFDAECSETTPQSTSDSVRECAVELKWNNAQSIGTPLFTLPPISPLTTNIPNLNPVPLEQCTLTSSPGGNTQNMKHQGSTNEITHFSTMPSIPPLLHHEQHHQQPNLHTHYNPHPFSHQIMPPPSPPGLISNLSNVSATSSTVTSNLSNIGLPYNLIQNISSISSGSPSPTVSYSGTSPCSRSSHSYLPSPSLSPMRLEVKEMNLSVVNVQMPSSSMNNIPLNSINSMNSINALQNINIPNRSASEPININDGVHMHTMQCNESMHSIPTLKDIANSMIHLPEHVLFSFFHSNCWIFETPCYLYNVPVNESKLRQNGMNLVSINYSTHLPNARQVLQRRDYLITFGLRTDIESYMTQMDIHSNVVDNKQSVRFRQFYSEIIKYYICYIPVPESLVGSTLSEIKLTQYGINVVAINLVIQHPLQMIEYRLKRGDSMLCFFRRAQHKKQQLVDAFTQIIGH